MAEMNRKVSLSTVFLSTSERVSSFAEGQRLLEVRLEFFNLENCEKLKLHLGFKWPVFWWSTPPAIFRHFGNKIKIEIRLLF